MKQVREPWSASKAVETAGVLLWSKTRESLCAALAGCARPEPVLLGPTPALGPAMRILRPSTWKQHADPLQRGPNLWLMTRKLMAAMLAMLHYWKCCMWQNNELSWILSPTTRTMLFHQQIRCLTASVKGSGVSTFV